MNKKDLSERDICSKFTGPAVKRAGWDGMMQIREEVNFTKGRIIVRGKLVTRGKAKCADYILYYKPNIPIAIIEAKDNNHSVGSGMQQALDYAVTLTIRLFSRPAATALSNSLFVCKLARKQAFAPKSYAAVDGISQK
jgi:type I restriction enzyme R subunit